MRLLLINYRSQSCQVVTVKIQIRNNVYLYQYVIIAAFFLLCFNSDTKLAAICFLFGWAFYILFAIHVDASFYYSLTAGVELCIGFYLNKRYRLVALLSYLLIFVNLYGLYLFINGMQPQYYDIIYAIVSIAQVILLILRGLINGSNRLLDKHALVRIVNFDSRKAYDRM